jgi:putative tryptophan/tyrosine transport system substrate-binding protein
LPELATELVRLPVDVLVADGARSISAAKGATSTIPIVMSDTADPVGLGFVASIARPGGNITGVSHLAAHLAGKRLELLRELAPAVARVAVLWDSRSRSNELQLQESQRAAETLGVQLYSVGVRDPNHLAAAFDTAQSAGADGLLVIHGGLLQRERTRVAQLATESRLPTMCAYREYVMAGGLMAYGPDIADQARRSATYVDKILKGARPAELPVEQPMRFDFTINLKTAQALGLAIPPHVLLQTTEVIQ